MKEPLLDLDQIKDQALRTSTHLIEALSGLNSSAYQTWITPLAWQEFCQSLHDPLVDDLSNWLMEDSVLPLPLRLQAMTSATAVLWDDPNKHFDACVKKILSTVTCAQTPLEQLNIFSKKFHHAQREKELLQKMIDSLDPVAKKTVFAIPAPLRPMMPNVMTILEQAANAPENLRIPQAGSVGDVQKIYRAWLDEYKRHTPEQQRRDLLAKHVPQALRSIISQELLETARHLCDLLSASNKDWHAEQNIAEQQPTQHPNQTPHPHTDESVPTKPSSLIKP